MDQQIRFCTASDGVRIAYATVGEGPPLVSVSGWVSHLKFEWDHRDMRSFIEGLARGRRLVRYDKRGTGLSDWDNEDFSLEARLQDLEAVCEALGLKRFDLIGFSEGGPTALSFAHRHPDRVSHLIIYGSFPRWPHGPEVMAPLLAMIRSQWGAGSAAIASVFVPPGDPAEMALFWELERVSASAETAARILEVSMGVDVTHLLKNIQVPTLIAHRRADGVVPFALAREMAALLPDARLEPLEGDIHTPWWGDVASVLDAIDVFLGTGEAGIKTAPDEGRPGLVTILFTDMEGSTTLTQRLGDAEAQELLRSHNNIIRQALKMHGGSEIKHTGDGIMASFPTASWALECAVALQRAFASQNDEHPDAPIRVRIGLNAGEPVVEDGDLFGTAVQLAARVCAQAEPGRILASNVVRELAAGKRFLFSDHGDVALRGFEDPVRLYEVYAK